MANSLLVTKHEVCKCGHCRCIHGGGFTYCARCPECVRYTWPGPGNDLYKGHQPTQKYKPQRKSP